jgi:hypothetical protein
VGSVIISPISTVIQKAICLMGDKGLFKADRYEHKALTYPRNGDEQWCQTLVSGGVPVEQAGLLGVLIVNKGFLVVLDKP